MSFGNKQLDNAYDKWVTQTPEEYFGLAECRECGREFPIENGGEYCERCCNLIDEAMEAQADLQRKYGDE